MAANINLLPRETYVNKNVGKAAGMLTMVSYAATALVAILGIAGFVTLLLLSRQLKGVEEETQTMRQNVATLQSAEQGLILAKDRAQKIQDILGSRRAETVLKTQNDLVTSLPDSFTFDSSKVDAQTSELGLITTSSKDLKMMLDGLGGRGLETAVLDDLTFSPSIGYALKLLLF